MTTGGNPTATLTLEEECQYLERLLAQHKRNLCTLHEQGAIYAASETPLHLLNQIEAKGKEIRRIKVELENLGD